MAVRDNKTEQHIIDTAMHVFFTEGRLNATTQDIADAAGINRTLIHYYFRSRDQLFDAVFEKARLAAMRESESVLATPLPFKKKTEKLIDVFLKRLKTYPFLELAITTGLNGKEADIPTGGPVHMKLFLKEIQQEMEKGTIQKTRPVHFLMNLFSLLIYPIMVKPLNMQLFGMNEPEYEKVVNERKKVIMGVLFPDPLKP
jgi:AcrR family transcriptional regulator